MSLEGWELSPAEEPPNHTITQSGHPATLTLSLLADSQNGLDVPGCALDADRLPAQQARIQADGHATGTGASLRRSASTSSGVSKSVMYASCAE